MSAELWRKEVEERLASLSLSEKLEFKALRRQFEGAGQWGLPSAVRLGRKILRGLKR